MSRYDKLDLLIFDKIKDGATSFQRIDTHEVRRESIQLEYATGKPAPRHIDSRLQAIKRRGLIEFKRPIGWRVV